MMSTQKRFWMVYVEGKSAPAKRHETRKSAWDEAERLVLMGNQEIYVLEAVVRCTRGNVAWEELNE